MMVTAQWLVYKRKEKITHMSIIESLKKRSLTYQKFRWTWKDCRGVQLPFTVTKNTSSMTAGLFNSEGYSQMSLCCLETSLQCLCSRHIVSPRGE